MGLLEDMARQLGERGASKGGRVRAQRLSPEQRSEIARKAVQTRWARAKGKLSVPGTGQMPTDDDIEVLAPDTDNYEGPAHGLPVAKYKGTLNLLDVDVPCYVLDNGLHVVGRTSMTELLTGIKGGGGLEKYLDVGSLRGLIPIDLVLERMVPFRLPEVEGLERNVKGLPDDLVIDIC